MKNCMHYLSVTVHHVDYILTWKLYPIDLKFIKYRDSCISAASHHCRRISSAVFSGAFQESRRAHGNFVMSVCLSGYISAAPTGRSFVKIW